MRITYIRIRAHVMSSGLDKSMLVALGVDCIADNDDNDVNIIGPDEQRDYILANVMLLDKSEKISVFRIATLDGFEKYFKPQGQTKLVINIDNLPDDTINQMYLMMNIILGKKKSIAMHA